MDLGCPLLRGSSDRRLRRCAATIVFAKSSDFEGSIREGDIDLFRNVTYCHAIVFSKKTSGNTVIVSILPRLSFSANTSNHSWSQFIVQDCCFIFRNWGKKWTLNFYFYSFPQRVNFLAVQYAQMNGCRSSRFGSNVGNRSIASISQLCSEQNTQCSALSSVFGSSSSSCSSQTMFFCNFVEFWRRLFCLQSFFVLTFCPVLPFSLLHLHRVNMSIVNLNELFSEFFSLSTMDQRWPGMGAMGSPWPLMGPLGLSWPSVICTGVSAWARWSPDSNPHRSHHNCEEMLLCFTSFATFCRKFFFLNPDILILHDERKLDFLQTSFFLV